MPSEHPTRADLIEENRALRARLAELEGAAVSERDGLGRLVESTRDAMWCVDGEYRLVVANSVFAEDIRQWLGRPLEVGECVLADSFPQEVSDEWRNHYNRALAGETFTVERKSDMITNRRWTEYQFQPVRDAGGSVTAAVVQSRDITLRKQREEQLASQAAMLDQIQDLLVVTDMEGRITFVNEAACASYGVTRDALIGKTVHAFGEDPAEGATQDEIIEGTRTNGEWHGQVVNIGANGRRIVLDCRTKVVRDAEGKPMAMIGVSRDVTERSAMERALRDAHDVLENRVEQRTDDLHKSEERLALAIEGAELGMWDWHVPSGKVDYSDSWAQILGYDPEEISPTLDGWSELLHPDDVERTQIEIQRSLSGDTPFYECEHRLRDKSGEYRWVLARGKVVERDADGTPIRHAGTYLDITKRKFIEAELQRHQGELERIIRERTRALRESEERLRLLFEGSSELISLTDAKAKTLWANASWKTVFGQFADRDDNAFESVHPEDAPKVAAAWKALVEEGREVRRMTYRFRVGHMPYLHFESNAFPIIIGGQRLYYVIAHDVTERVHAEKALRESEERFRNVFATMGTGVAVYEAVEGGRDFVFKDINPSGERMSKVRRSDILGRRLTALFPNVEEMGLLRKLRAALHTGEPQYLPITQYHDDRITQWVENHVFRLPSGEVVAVYDDVTERRQYETRLHDNQTQLRALAAELAEAQEAERKRIARELHDHVGQTLSALGLNLNMALNRLPATGAEYSTERLGRALTLVEQTGHHIRDVIAALRPSVLDDYGIAPGLRWYAGEVLRRSETPVVVEASDDLPRFDPPVETAMFRIAQEAIGNAVRHAQAHEIRVSLAIEDAHILMTIADDGIGFDADALPPHGGRSGWGMATMQERARAVGGELIVESKPRQGTRVTLSIPV